VRSWESSNWRRASAHSGESGRARENVLAEALGQLIPDNYGIGTGFVIDGVGGISRQVDIIIFRRGYHPVFVIGGISHYMVESVVAVIENKASIESSKRLDQALANIKSVKVLDRTNQGTNYAVHGSMRGEAIKPDDYGYQVWGGIVTERSMSEALLKETVLRFLRTEERRFWPNMYADLHRFTGYYLYRDPEGGALNITDRPQLAERWVLTRPDSPHGVPPPRRALRADSQPPARCATR
jgi:Domain of unknown function (DUF6602)